MRNAVANTDPEVRRRLTQLISRGERTSLLTPKLVSLHVEHKPVGQVLADLSQQTGYKLGCQQGSAQVVTLNIDNMPFWQTVDLICQQTGLGLQPYYDNTNTLMFYRVGKFSPHVCYAGPFRISAGSFHLSKTLELNAQQQFGLGANALFSPPRTRTEALTFAFHVIGEPKVPLMSLGQTQLSKAIDDQGNSLLPPQVRNYETNYHNYYYGYRNPQLQSQVQLVGPGTAQTLRLLKGTLPVTFLAEQRPEITIQDIMNVKNQKFEGGQVSFEIEEVKETNKQIHVKATARRNAPENQQDYTWTNSLAQRVELVDEKGLKFQCDSFNWDNGTPTSVSGTFQFSSSANPSLGKPAKLVYYNWIMSQHQIEFQFSDLPLP
jgi:hypothetical protein